MSNALEFNLITKIYRGGQTSRSLRDVVDVRRRLHAGRRSPVIALDHVSFSIAEGESFGMIGQNGAGKTTALKVACRITSPTSGSARVRGRIGALIEVGTGLHPELTGEENIRLYGQILGIPPKEIANRFDRIVDFAGIGSALGQPVKQYSSGMQLRLGFAVAAHVEPDILIVDEAIAVGDAGFQYRCVQRMAELVGEGRTLVFVSHDLGAIEGLCTRAIRLDGGTIVDEGTGADVVARYLDWVREERDRSERSGAELEAKPDQSMKVTAVTLHHDDGRPLDELETGESLVVRLHYETIEPVPSPYFSVGIGDPRVGLLALASMLSDGACPDELDGSGVVECRFEGLPLNPEVYDVWMSVRGAAGYGDIVGWQRTCLLRVAGNKRGLGVNANTVTAAAPLALPHQWTVDPGA